MQLYYLNSNEQFRLNKAMFHKSSTSFIKMYDSDFQPSVIFNNYFTNCGEVIFSYPQYSIAVSAKVMSASI